MVDWYGRWTPEENYDNYPEEKMCDMDRLYVGIKEMHPDFAPKASWPELLDLIFWFFDEDWEEYGYDDDSVKSCLEYVYDSDLNEFDSMADDLGRDSI